MPLSAVRSVRLEADPPKGAVMKRSRRDIYRLALTLVLLAVAAGVRTGAAGPSAALARLQAQIERAARGARGSVGVVVKHVESGAEIAVNGDEPYPMASTFKLPVLVELHAKAK